MLRCNKPFTSFRDGPKDQTRNLEIPGSLASLAPRNDGETVAPTPSPSRDIPCPGSENHRPSENATNARRLRGEGAGKAGPPAQPAALRVKIENTQVSHHRSAGNARPSLREWCYGFLRALPGDRALCHRSWRIVPPT